MTESSDPQPKHKPEAALLPTVRQFVLNQMNIRQDGRLLFHNYDFTIKLADKTAEIARGQGLPPERAEIPQLAAWFVALGYFFDYENHAKRSDAVASRFLEAQNYPLEKRKQILACLQVLKPEKKPATPEEELLKDAYTIINYIDQYGERNPLKKLEWELMTERQYGKLEWAQLQLQHLLSARLYTHYARSTYEGFLAQNIRRQKEAVEKIIRRQGVPFEEIENLPAENFEGLEEGVPQRALQTFFRTNFRNHINLSAIADNKANIMISVNSILISVLLTILTYRNMANINPKVVLPAVIFLVSALASLIFAILSARPKVTNLNGSSMPKEAVRKNIVFFGNFVQLDLDQYEEAVDAMFRDSSLLYGNMARDLYHLGQVLAKKYHYLSIAYNIFMMGFIVSVITFLIVLFL